MSSRSRGQSEVIGVVLLTGVIVVLVVLVGVVLFSASGSQTDREPLADIESVVSDTTVTIRHQGGDSFAPAAIELTVRGATTCTASLTDDTVTTADDGQFAPGTTWVFDPAGTCLNTETVTILVADTASHTLLHDAKQDVP
jgi:flagellin-like protein